MKKKRTNKQTNKQLLMYNVLTDFCQEVLELMGLRGSYFARNMLKRLSHDLDFVGNEFCRFTQITNLLVGLVILKSK